jgi:hypothetical protein
MAEPSAVNGPRHDFSLRDRAVTRTESYRFAWALRSASSSASTIASSVSTR